MTGTGTDVGKTVIAAALARAEAESGARVSAYKPAASGLDELPTTPAEPSWDVAADLPDHQLLRLAGGLTQDAAEICPRTFGPAVSPHLATALAGEPSLEPAGMENAAWSSASDAEAFICEGVGGALVPLCLDPPYLVRDLIVALGLPAVVVASPGLGTINHTLLTLESLRAVGVEIDRVVLNPWPSEPGSLEVSNRETVEALGDCPVEVFAEVDLARPQTWPSLGPLPAWRRASA